MRVLQHTHIRVLPHSPSMENEAFKPGAVVAALLTVYVYTPDRSPVTVSVLVKLLSEVSLTLRMIL